MSASPAGESHADPFPVVGIGASAGGLEAFTELLQHLSPETGMAFVLVQHLEPTRPSSLAQILARSATMPVVEITDGLRVEPNHVYVIGPAQTLEIHKGVLKCERRKGLPNDTLGLIDTFFESLAHDQQDCAIGIILSGAASDGTLGLEAIKAESGITFAQDESAAHPSMPRSAIAAGGVDFILSPKEIARELDAIAKHPAMGPRPEKAGSPPRARRERTQAGGASCNCCASRRVLISPSTR